MKKLRQIHYYLGVLFAPSILFFALTGAYQTFRWNENGVSGALEPVLAQMASIHKNSALERASEPRPDQPRAASAPRRPERDAEGGKGKEAPRGPSPLPLKIYVFLMSLGLITSTGTGVAMAFKYKHERRVLWGLLIAGTILPIGLLFV